MYYKFGQLLQIRATVTTKQGSYYKLGQVLQIRATITNWGITEASPVKGCAFKAHMIDNEKQEKAKIVQEVADDKMVEGKDTSEEKMDKASMGKGAKDELVELLEERPRQSLGCF